MSINAKKIKIHVMIAIIFATLAFIWANSMLSTPDSAAVSESFTDIIRPILEPVVGRGHVTDHLVRKLAHFTEFFLLGGEMALLLVFMRRVRLQPIVNCLFVGLSTAVVDETIQIFTDRGSQVQDVLLDFAGAVTGLGLVILVYILISQLKKRRHRHK